MAWYPDKFLRYDRAKTQALEKVACGAPIARERGETHKVGPATVRARYANPQDSGERIFRFPYGGKAHRADYQLWVCGESGIWYLLRSSILDPLYFDPNAYPHNKPYLRALAVDVRTNRADYATGKTISILSYRQARLLR